MGLFYKEEHLTCYHYQLPASANFRISSFPKNDRPQQLEVDRSVIAFLLKGEALVSCNNYKDKLQKEGEMLLLPRNSSCYVKVLKDSVVLTCGFVQDLQFCDRFSFQQLSKFLPSGYKYDFMLLPIRERLGEFLLLLEHCLEDKLSCNHFHEMKRQELLLMLRAYYSKEELATFFCPLIGENIDFKDFVLANYLSVNNVVEFAELANLGIDTFKRRFKESFGESAHKWIAQRKAELIYRDLITTEKSFLDIAMDYKMSSQAYLNAFCKKHFDKTPQELREQGKLW